MALPIWQELNVDRPTPEQVRRYMLDRGWQIQPHRPELIVFEGPLADNGERIIQVLPSSETLVDYSIRLHEMLKALSVIENRPVREILADMLPHVQKTVAG
jgi:hypothetical protein